MINEKRHVLISFGEVQLTGYGMKNRKKNIENLSKK